jgi:hypothetical protein
MAVAGDVAALAPSVADSGVPRRISWTDAFCIASGVPALDDRGHALGQTVGARPRSGLLPFLPFALGVAVLIETRMIAVY